MGRLDCDRCGMLIDPATDWGNCMNCGDDICEPCAGDGFDAEGRCWKCHMEDIISQRNGGDAPYKLDIFSVMEAIDVVYDGCQKSRDTGVITVYMVLGSAMVAMSNYHAQYIKKGGVVQECEYLGSYPIAFLRQKLTETTKVRVTATTCVVQDKTWSYTCDAVHFT